MNLDPAKLLVILVIGLLVLGPERLPRVARQLGHLWHEFTTARDRLVDEIREQVPDLPHPRSFRSILIDPLSAVDTRVPVDSDREGKAPTGGGQGGSVEAWTAHQRGSQGVSQPNPSDIVDPTMN
ncbi:MAG TPA: twin-arginine translocase TatA/TatE family subunit [Acidimicrobiales bacterium]|nr:twin-arginine translocase TatA/TatE family subunit [Acidimicrobiales bacterium]